MVVVAMMMMVMVIIVWVITVVVIARVAPPGIVIAVVTMIPVDDTHRAILDRRQHVIGHRLADAGLLEAVDVVGLKNVNGRRRAQIPQDGGLTDFVAAKVFDV